MPTPEEKYNEHCNAAATLLKEKKYQEAFSEAQKAFEIALHTAKFASSEERPKWVYRTDKALDAARIIDTAIKNTIQSGSASGQDPETVPVSAVRPKERLADVSGMQEAKDEVRMSVIEPIRKPEKAKKYGLRLGGGLLLYGLPGTGKTFFAKAVAGELGLPFYVIKNDDILCKYLGESEKIVKNIFDAARKNPMSVVFIDETNGILPCRSDDSVHEVSKRIAEIILQETDGFDSKEKNPFLLIGATNFPDKIDDAALSRFTTCIEVDLPDSGTRKFILAKELGAMEININASALDNLVQKTEGFSCRDLVNLSAHYRKCAAKEEIQEFTDEFCAANFKDNHIRSESIAQGIREFKKRVGKGSDVKKKQLTADPPAEKQPEAEPPAPITPSPALADAPSKDEVKPESLVRDPLAVTFADVKGLNEAKEVVQRALINPTLYPEVYKTLRLIPGSGLLLYGPPGTGKTMFARAIANELRCQFFSVELSDIKGKNPLQTTEKISALFAMARNSEQGSVIFIDDCEEILSRPGNSKAYGVSQFLTELDGLKTSGCGRVFVLVATNRPWMIDGALLRSGRISASVYIGLPDFEVRKDLIRTALKGIMLAPDINMDRLAEMTDGYSCAEINHSLNGGGICNLARDYAADRWVNRIQEDESFRNIAEPVTMADFEKAIAAIAPCAVREADRIAANERFRQDFSTGKTPQDTAE